jgi:hypothetical protein
MRVSAFFVFQPPHPQPLSRRERGARVMLLLGSVFLTPDSLLPRGEKGWGGGVSEFSRAQAIRASEKVYQRDGDFLN